MSCPFPRAQGAHGAEFSIFDFTLDDEDMAEIAGLDSEESLFFSYYDPATVERLIGYGKSK